MCNTEYKLYQLDKTGYREHQFGVMKDLHQIERIKLHRILPPNVLCLSLVICLEKHVKLMFVNEVKI